MYIYSISVCFYYYYYYYLVSMGINLTVLLFFYYFNAFLLSVVFIYICAYRQKSAFSYPFLVFYFKFSELRFIFIPKTYHIHTADIPMAGNIPTNHTF